MSFPCPRGSLSKPHKPFPSKGAKRKHILHLIRWLLFSSEISGETKNTLEKAVSLEKEGLDQVGANDAEHERAFRHYQDITLEQQTEIESIERKVKVMSNDSPSSNGPRRPGG